jgi:tetratricopeptide (TPR) repeat protein
LKKLAALGYLGSASPPENAENLPSPRAHIGELRSIRAAKALFASGNYRDAIEALKAVVAAHPAMADTWGDLADAYRRLGRLDEALAALREQDRLAPGSPFVLIAFSGIALEAGKIEDAKRWAERAIAAADIPETHENYAHVLLVGRDLAGARREAERALAGHEGRALPKFVLALVARGSGDLPASLAGLDALAKEMAARGEPELALLELTRGEVLAELGRFDEAEAAFRREISNHPATLRAWVELAQLLSERGRTEEALALVRQMRDGSPNPQAAQVSARLEAILRSRR